MTALENHLLKTRTPAELVRELVALAKTNVALKDRVGALEHELFWMRAAEREVNPIVYQGRVG